MIFLQNFIASILSIGGHALESQKGAGNHSGSNNPIS